jgi:hypothetical protein
MNAPPTASSSPLPARDDLPDLDRLVQLACRTAGVQAALLVEWTLPQPLVLGRHGLGQDQTDLALAVCLQALATPEIDACIPDLTLQPALAGRSHACARTGGVADPAGPAAARRPVPCC